MDNLSLDEHGIMAGTDKCSLDHDYLRHYEAEFSSFREQAINLIEIGILGGASLGLWEKFFSRAQIVGVDIKPECAEYRTDRVAIEIGSQADVGFLSRVADKYPPTIVIDDGSHRADHVQITFEHLFPMLLPGGVYVIEDLHFHIGRGAAKWRGEGTVTPPDYINALATALAAPGKVTPEMNLPPQAIVDSIERIVHVRRAAFIWKKQEDGPLAHLEHLRTVVEKSRKHANWRRLSEMIMTSGGNLDEAEAAAREGISIAPRNWKLRSSLAKVLEKKGEVDAALATLNEARDLAPEKEKASLARDEARLAKMAGSSDEQADSAEERD